MNDKPKIENTDHTVYVDENSPADTVIATIDVTDSYSYNDVILDMTSDPAGGLDLYKIVGKINMTFCV